MMDKDAQVVAGFLALLFVFSFAFHFLYAKGMVFDYAMDKLEKQGQPEAGSSHTPRVPEEGRH